MCFGSHTGRPSGSFLQSRNLAMQLWIAKISNLNSLSHFEKLQSESLSVCLNIKETIHVLLSVTKARSDCCELPLEITEENPEKKEVTASL